MLDVLTWILALGAYLLMCLGLVVLIIGAMAYVVNWLLGERDE